MAALMTPVDSRARRSKLTKCAPAPQDSQRLTPARILHSGFKYIFKNPEWRLRSSVRTVDGENETCEQRAQIY